MVKRKTIDIEKIVELVNATNSCEVSTKEQRNAVSFLLEDILHETGNYQGFRYLTSCDLPEGIEPGIVFDKSGEHNHVYPDPSRIQYFYKNS